MIDIEFEIVKCKVTYEMCISLNIDRKMEKFSSHLSNCKYYVSYLCLITLCLPGSWPVMSNETTMPPPPPPPSLSTNFTTSQIIESEPITDKENIPGWGHISGWQCHCWKSTNESEVSLNFRSTKKQNVCH